MVYSGAEIQILLQQKLCYPFQLPNVNMESISKISRCEHKYAHKYAH